MISSIRIRPPKLALLCALLACWVTLLQSAALAQTATFGAYSLEAGEMIVVTEGMTMTMSVDSYLGSRRAGTNEVETRQKSRYRVRVLEAAGGVPTSLELRYELDETTNEIAGQAPHIERGELAGRRFLVGQSADGTSVTDARGREVSAETRAQVLVEIGELGSSDPFCQQVTGSELELGSEVSLDEADLTGFFAAIGANAEVDRLSLKLVRAGSRRGLETGVFEVRMVASVLQDGQRVRMSLAGIGEIATANCRTLSLELKGPVRVSGEVEAQGQTVTVRGSGTVRLVSYYEYP